MKHRTRLEPKLLTKTQFAAQCQISYRTVTKMVHDYADSPGIIRFGACGTDRF